MTARITPLRLEAFEQLPKHARRCVFWEVDPSTLGGDAHLSDPEFEKEAWLSMVMLDWGSCGQIAASLPAGGRTGADDAGEDCGDAPCLGYAFYAPPSAVPRARLFPSGPVSADAVLLTSLGIDAGAAHTRSGMDPSADGLSQSLIVAVVGDLVRRGVRALEAFGRTEATAELADPRLVPAELAPVVEVLGDCSVDQCVLDADFLEQVGFVEVSKHRYFPRLRLELESGLGWKAGVEAALERLLESEKLKQPVGAGSNIA
ncbi:acetyltransferase [Mycolicibacterium moriokaense]|nr:acetyltransferase [Mycolicibacterium moriokaense]